MNAAKSSFVAQSAEMGCAHAEQAKLDPTIAATARSASDG